MGRRQARRSTPKLRRQIPVRTFADWNDPEPGFFEVELVAHCGETMGGSFAHTLVLTDIASGWTECVALLIREATVVVDAIERLRVAMPFPLRGVDTDNGSELINESLLAYCAENSIEFTRSRPYRKNDQAWVEQKNGSVVRRLAGYRRLEGIAAAQSLARLYSASRLFVNFFQPSFKLAEKTIAKPMKDRLRAVLATLDPLRLLDEIRTVQHHLAALASGDVVSRHSASRRRSRSIHEGSRECLEHIEGASRAPMC